jgi:dTDP-4-dehydrorhamnose 3,5-epimerase
MKIVKQLLNDVLLLKPRSDVHLGYENASWSVQDLAVLGISNPFVQDNQSQSKHGVIRGLHYQIEHPQGKLIRVASGSIVDVALDLRRTSPNFGKHAMFELSAENGLLAWLPPGYAHGSLVSSDIAVVLYSVTDYRFPEHERTILWNDPHLSIAWPIESIPVIVSEKDRDGIPFSSADRFP